MFWIVYTINKCKLHRMHYRNRKLFVHVLKPTIIFLFTLSCKLINYAIIWPKSRVNDLQKMSYELVRLQLCDPI